MASPFAAGPIPTYGASAQHGTAEQWSGTVFGMPGVGGPFGMTPPLSPRRSPSPRAGPRRGASPRRDDDEDLNRDRERDRDRRRRPNVVLPADEEQPLPEGWGTRMLAAENKIRELNNSLESVKRTIEDVNDKANLKIDQMKIFVQEVDGRFTQLERSLPERIHNIEQKSDHFVTLVNGLTVHLQNKCSEIEESIRRLSVPPAPAPAPASAPPMPSTVPPVPPSFGGATPNTQHFGIGSPLSGPDAQPDPWSNFSRSRTAYSSGGAPTSAENNRWNSGAAPPSPFPAAYAAPVGTHRPFDAREWNAVDVKVAKELKPFNGTHAAYKIWANRVKDHFKKKNTCWGHLFSEIEAQKIPINKNSLVLRTFNVDGRTYEVDLAWASNAIWTFVGEHVVDTVYTNRGILCGGGENGLELWRGLFMKHEGGAVQVELGGMGSLHGFPQCDKPENLQLWVGKWQEMKDMFGTGISDIHLKSMFINILPPAVQKEVRERPDLTTLQNCIDHVLSDLGRINDAHLSKMHMERLKQSLSTSQRISPVMNMEETGDSAEASDNTSKPEDKLHLVVNALSEKMESLVAAIARPKPRAQPKRGASDFAKFGDRCLHCGSDKHRAKDCPVKKSLLEKNGGNFPEGYKSAFDKWKEKQPKKSHVGALLDDDDESEFSETDLTMPIWCLPQCAVTSRCSGTCGGTNFEHSNPFAPIFDDNDDDEDKIVEALKHISSNATVGPKMSQRQKKSSSSPPTIDRKDVAKLAKLVRSGALGLPDLNLESDSDYEAVWHWLIPALLDPALGVEPTSFILRLIFGLPM